MALPKTRNSNPVDWFDDSTLRDSLGVRSVRGFSLTFGAQILKLVVNTGATAVLARLLMPGDFGLVALLVSVTGVAHIFRDLGLPLATIQRSRLTAAECNSIFWVTLLIGAVVTALVGLSGPLLASFFGDRRIALITPVLSLMFLFASLGSQHQALLRRGMRFGALSAIELGSTAGSYLLAILLAWKGAGFWALVLQQVALFAISSACLWMACSWRPGRPAWESSVSDMMGFGRNVTLSNMMNYAGRNVDNILIGKVSGAAELGFYSKAYQLLLLPIWQINAPISAVVMPALSRLQHEPAEFRKFYLKAVLGMVVLGMPVVAFTFACAPEFIRLFLGPGWEEAAHLFRLLAPAAFMDTFNLAGGLVLHALGYTGRQLRLTIISTLLILAAFGVGIIWGARGVAIAFSTVIVLSRFPAIAYSFINSPLRLLDLLHVIWRPAAISVLAGAVLYVFPHEASANVLRLGRWLALEGTVFAALYLLGWIVVPGGRESIADAMAIWSRLIGSKR